MFSTKQDCNNCKDESICRWCSEMKRNKDEVSRIPVCKGMSPIRVTTTCNSFEGEISKQDGFNVNGFYVR